MYRMEGCTQSLLRLVTPRSKAPQKGCCCPTFMPLMESELAQSLAIVRSEYKGPIEVASDLKAYQIGA